MRTVIVTGSSSGIGRATAANLRRNGWRVFATARHPADGDVALDVTSDDSVAAAVDAVMSDAGRIDAIVNNAGVDLVGAVEETSVAEAESLFQTNFFGVHRLTRAVLPIMRAQGGGRILTVGSIAGFLPLPFGAFYTASKHALEGYVEALQAEVRPYGIRCVLVEPGYIATDLRGKKIEAATRLQPYAQIRAAVDHRADTSVQQGISPDHVARAITHALSAPHPRLRQRVGRDAATLSLVRRFLPEPLFQAGMRRQFGL